jgi:hypothetical protein
MEDQFDRVSKAIASGMSRREVMRLIGAGILGALLGPFGAGEALAANQTSDCNHYCNQFKHPDKQICRDNCRGCAGGVAAMCGPTCCAAGTVCVDGACVVPCVPLDGVCDPTAATNPCCPGSFCPPVGYGPSTCVPNPAT